MCWEICKKTYRSLPNVTTETDGDCILQHIAKFGEDWFIWIQNSTLLALICPAFSDMSREDRMGAFTSTNCVEDHNRRGNLLCGTHMHPIDAVRSLGGVEKVDVEEFCEARTLVYSQPMTED